MRKFPAYEALDIDFGGTDVVDHHARETGGDVLIHQGEPWEDVVQRFKESGYSLTRDNFPLWFIRAMGGLWSRLTSR